MHQSGVMIFWGLNELIVGDEPIKLHVAYRCAYAPRCPRWRDDNRQLVLFLISRFKDDTDGCPVRKAVDCVTVVQHPRSPLHPAISGRAFRAERVASVFDCRVGPLAQPAKIQEEETIEATDQGAEGPSQEKVVPSIHHRIGPFDGALSPSPSTFSCLEIRTL